MQRIGHNGPLERIRYLGGVQLEVLALFDGIRDERGRVASNVRVHLERNGTLRRERHVELYEVAVPVYRVIGEELAVVERRRIEERAVDDVLLRDEPNDGAREEVRVDEEAVLLPRRPW